MSRLSFIGRPWENFNAAERQHREWFMEFNRLGTWGRCPVRFIVDDESGDLLTLIRRKLLAYYTEQEFGKDNITEGIVLAA